MSSLNPKPNPDPIQEAYKDLKSDHLPPAVDAHQSSSIIALNNLNSNMLQIKLQMEKIILNASSLLPISGNEAGVPSLNRPEHHTHQSITGRISMAWRLFQEIQSKQARLLNLTETLLPKKEIGNLESGELSATVLRIDALEMRYRNLTQGSTPSFNHTYP